MPEQTGALNLIDNERYVYSLGCGFDFPNPMGSSKTVGLDFAFQHSILASRDTRKSVEFADMDGDGTAETRVLGYPGFRSGGDVFVLSGAFYLNF